MEEPVLDNSSRAAILSQLLNKQKEAAAGQLCPSALHIQEAAPAKPVVEVKSDKPTCKNCGHKIWNDGAEWQHSGKEHDVNCDCRKPEPKAKAGEAIVSAKTFDSTTPAATLLEAVINNKVEEVKRDAEEQVAKDAVRRAIIEKVNGQGDNFMKNWRF